MEPIVYANGSTLEDPALTYGIVFSNFMSKGVYTFEGGTDQLIGLMHAVLRSNGVDVRIKCDRGGDRSGAGPRCGPCASTAGPCQTRAVISNANLQATIFRLVATGALRSAIRRAGPRRAAEQLQHAGLHGDPPGSSPWTKPRAICCSAPRPASFAPNCCSVATSPAARFRSTIPARARTAGRAATSCPAPMPTTMTGPELTPEEYEAGKHDLIETTLGRAREVRARYPAPPRPTSKRRRPRHSPTIRSTSPGRASARNSRAWASAAVLPEQVQGLYHAGSVGIIMSGWLGAINYGVIVANDVDALLLKAAGAVPSAPEGVAP